MKIARLTRGSGKEGGPGCWMTVLSQFVGEGEWTDRLDCVDPLVNQLCIGANDLLPDDESRAELIGPRLFDPIGTSGTQEETNRRLLVVCDWTLRKFAEKWMARQRDDGAGYFAAMPRIDSLVVLQDARFLPCLDHVRTRLKDVPALTLSRWDYALAPTLNVLDWTYSMFTGLDLDGHLSPQVHPVSSSQIIANEALRMACIAYGADPNPRSDDERVWLSPGLRREVIAKELLPMIDEVIKTGPRGAIELPAAERCVRELCPANF